jgi:DNA polymerase-3 subunit delta
MTPEQALREAKERRLRPVYLIVGEERHLQAEVLRALREAAVEGGMAGLNEDQFVAGDVSVDAVLSAARTLPMMARQRLVVVRQVERWEAKESTKQGADKDDAKKSDALDRLAQYAQAPAETTVLLLVAGKLDRRRKLAAAAQQQGFVVSCEPLQRRDLPHWIVARARERSASIGHGAADLIAELAGPELSTVADALERLCLFVGNDRAITENDVAECIIRVRPTTVWELVNAIGRRDLEASLERLAQVFDPQERGISLVGALAWSARQFLRFESALSEGLAPPEAAKRASAPPYRVRELSQQVKMIPRVDIERWLVVLAAVDADLKGGSKRPPRAVLETAIIEMCRGAAPSARRAPGASGA